MTTGIIASKRDQGYGFIKVEGREKDLFFHTNELVDITFEDIQEGDTVEFEEVEGEKGPQAIKVSRVS